MTKENKELAIFQQIQPLQIFQDNKADDFLKGVEKEVEEFKKIRDISTPKGRAEIKSFAFKIAQTKAPLDKAGLGLTEEMRSKVKLINAERARIKERLEGFQNDVRQPLTDFENKEKERIRLREDRIDNILNISKILHEKTIKDFDINFVQDLISQLDPLIVFDWQEFESRAKKEYEEIKELLQASLDSVKERDRIEAEREKLRKEKEERDLKEREAQIVREATEKAERIAREEAQRKAKFAEDEKYRLEAEKKALELAKIEAEKRVQQEILEAQQRIEQIKIQTEKDQEEAIKRERARVEAQRVKEEHKEKARAENLAHRTKIYQEMISSLSQFTKDEKCCKALIKAIAEGKISNIFIKY